MSKSSPALSCSARRPVGRPARVNMQAILEAALALGLDQLTMKAVADRLGVGISTLYQYVKNRDELVQLAALNQAMTRTPPRNSGQHWAELAVQYAQDLLDTLTREPRLVVELMRGGLGPRVEADVLEHFLAAMHAHGFDPEQGVRLYRAISMVTIGGAVGALSVEGIRERGTSHPQEIERALAERGPDELPLTRAALREYQREDRQIWLAALHDLLSAVARERGENLPPSLGAGRMSAVITETSATGPRAASESQQGPAGGRTLPLKRTANKLAE